MTITTELWEWPQYTLATLNIISFVQGCRKRNIHDFIGHQCGLATFLMLLICGGISNS